MKTKENRTVCVETPYGTLYTPQATQSEEVRQLLHIPNNVIGVFDFLIYELQQTNNSDEIWSDGNYILAKSETTANAIADFLDAIGYTALTGYFDPEEETEAEHDSLTGYWYVDID
jgi:hypothetical protein